MDISIIIVNYNVKEYIISCIDSIYKHSKSKNKFEIIVINNSPEDGASSEIEKRFSEVLLLDSDSNIGFSRAVNQAAKISKGEYLFILNPDTLFIEDSIQNLLIKAKENKKIAIVGPKILSKKNEPEQSFWRKPNFINTLMSIYYLDLLNHWKNYKDKEFLEISEVETISGCAILIKNNIFGELKGFNENLFWMEDIDLCVRAKKLGYNIYYSPETKIIHYKGQSAKTNWDITITNQQLSKIKYFKIHHSIFSTISL